MKFDVVRIKKNAARSKIISALITVLISGLLVSIPIPANAAACVPTSTTASNGEIVLTFTTVGTCNWTPPTGITSVRVLVVGGGGSGSAGINNYYWPAGGGGGEVITDSSVTDTPNT